MRLYPELFPVKSLLQPEDSAVMDAALSQSKTETAVSFVHGNITFNPVSDTAVDVAAIAERARAARSVWIGSKLKSYYEVLVRRFAQAGQAGKSDYLGASQSLADLEARIRVYESTHARY